MHSKFMPYQRVVVVGGGTAGWMAVSLIQRAWPSVEVSLVESVEIATIGVGEGSTPYLREFFRQLGIAESEWMPACNATYKCGISFPNWSTKAGFESYCHPFFSALDLPTGNDFMRNACIRRRRGDVPAHPDDFWVSTRLAQQRRSPVPAVDIPLDPDYGYHFDSGLLGNFLKQRALNIGLRHIVDTVESVRLNEAGDIAALNTAAHGELAGDFFIDCTGFAGLLISKTLNVPFNSYKDDLFNDCAVAIASRLDNTQPIPSQTVSEALSCGWAWKIPLSNRYGNGYVYSSDYLTAEAAEAELRAHIGPSCEGMAAKHLQMRVGRLEQHWCKNVLAVGLSQGFIEPLEATALMLVQFTVDRFIYSCNQLQQAEVSIESVRDVFNAKVNANFEGVKDYIVAHYRLNSRTDSAYWRDCRNDALMSDRLRSILAAWDSGADFEATLSQFKGELSYLRPSWYCLLAGMGRFPESLSAPPADKTVASEIRARQHCEAVAAKFADHRDHLRAIYGELWPTAEVA